MSAFIIPQSFIGRSYAEQHFSQIVQFAAEHHPYYRRVIASNPSIPILTREILQKNNLELLNGNPVTGTTSGATSMPVRTHWSKQRIDLDAKDSSFYAGCLGGRLPHAKIVALASHKAKPNNFEVAAPVAEQWVFLRDQINQGVRSLVSYPTNLVQLANYLIQNEQQVLELQRIICMSELFESSQEAIIRKAFPNAQIAATYSSTEVGMIAVRCPHQPENYHIMAHKLGLEFLNANGEPCQDGELGQIIVTDYFNRKMPLIRYAIGDMAAPSVCPCGKIPLPALTKLLGKTRGLLKHPDGGYVYSTALSTIIRDIDGIGQFQVQQIDANHFVCRVVAQEGADRTIIESQLFALFTKNFGNSIVVNFDWCANIPRLPGGKYMEFIGLMH